MNCKPGDLAMIIRSPYAGMMVEVLYLAPTVPHVLPDGYPHVACKPAEWVVKSLGSPFVLRTDASTRRIAMYACCFDSALRPLPGKLEDEQVEDQRELTIS